MLNVEFQRTARRDKKPSSTINAKKQRKTTQWGRLESLQENQRQQRNFTCKDGHNKGQKWYGPNRSKKILRRGGKNTELYKNYLHDPDNPDGVTTQSQTSWNVKSSGPQEASL